MTMPALLARLIAGPATHAQLRAAFAINDAQVLAQLEQLRSAGIVIDEDAEGKLQLLQPVELLDRDIIIRALSDAAGRELATMTIDFETGSTQQQALASVTPPQGCGVWLAEHQTAGQGQRGRAWATPFAAGVAMSLSKRFNRALAQLSGLSLAVGVSVADALHALGYPQIGVKWPNDLVADGRKLGGILIQMRGSATGPSEVVIGIGINRQLPVDAGQHIDQPWCDLSMLRPQAPPSRNALVAAIINHVLPALRAFDDDGLAPFLPRWRALDALAERPVRVLDGAKIFEGIARGVDASGALRVAHGDSERLYHSGDVSLRPA